MLLSAVRRRRNELSNREQYQRKTNPVWTETEPPEKDTNRWKYVPAPPKPRRGTAKTARPDHWTGPLRVRRTQLEGEIRTSRDYFGKYDPMSGWARQQWLKKKESFQWSVPGPMVEGELDRLNHIIAR